MSEQAVAGKVYPSAKAILTHKLGCRANWWRLYWSEGGAELTLYQTGEGPQEASSIEEALEWIGGDQPAQLNPGTIRWVNEMPASERATVLAEIKAGIMGKEETVHAISDEEFIEQIIERVRRGDLTSGEAAEVVAILLGGTRKEGGE